MKQTVMTSVYGVTYVGARDQIKRRLKERNAIDDDTKLFSAACYAAKVKAVGMFVFCFEMSYSSWKILSMEELKITDT